MLDVSLVEKGEDLMDGAKERTAASSSLLALSSDNNGAIVSTKEKRTSSLRSPTVGLLGHAAEVFCVEFSPDGQILASGGMDRDIFLWKVYGAENSNVVMSGHSNAVLQLQYDPSGEYLFSCSADRSVCIWDVSEGKRVKKLTGHTSCVNSCSSTRRSPALIVSASDDGSCKVWDVRTRKHQKTFHHSFQMLSVLFDDTGDRVFAGSLDHTIRVYDMRMNEENDPLIGHTDSVTGIALSDDGHFLCSNAMDMSLRRWNIQPFFPGISRCVERYVGGLHSCERNLLRVAFNKDDTFISSGSSDGILNIWEVESGDLAYKLPGHEGSLNDIAWHPKEPIIATASSDKTVILGELN